MREAAARRAEHRTTALTLSTAELLAKAPLGLSHSPAREPIEKFLDLSLRRPQAPVLYPPQVDQSEPQSQPAPSQAAELRRYRLLVDMLPSPLRNRPVPRWH